MPKRTQTPLHWRDKRIRERIVPIEVKVPPLPESVTDATLVAWHKKAGEAVHRDENLVDLETDKVVLEVPAPRDGVIKEIRVPDGTTVTSGEILAILEPAELPARPEAPSAAAATPAAATAKPTTPAPAAAAVAERTGGSVSAAAPADTAKSGRPEAEAKLGPAARVMIEEHDLDAANIKGSGRDGRITKGDVMRHMAEHGDSDLGADTGDRAEARGTRPRRGSDRLEHRVPMTRLRKRIAERLVESQHTAAMLTTFNEADMSAIIALRKRYQEQFVAEHGIKLGFMSFFVRASIESLKHFPVLNASIDGEDVVYHEYFDIGVAVSTDRGLLVPVLRSAQDMSFASIENAIADVGNRARAGEITMDELKGGTFTITNGGIFGSMMSTPILNPPQSGILGMHSITERPVVVDGQIVARPMMYLALTYDHRIVDGRDAVQFLVHLKQQLEDPARLLIQV